jgi:uncharacterized protein (TIGR02466 family)
MNDPFIELIFPTPVMFNTLDRKLTKKELNFVDFHSNHVYKNSGNVTSNNNYILHEPEMKKLHDYLLENVKVYIDKIVKPKHKVKPFITQSWLNYTKKGEFHHKHEHPNSFLSGVFYVNADQIQDKITFHRFGYKQIQLATENYDILNADSWWFNIKTNDVVIFPSSLTHHVDNVTADKTRISLAFNTFIKGTLGDKQSLTEFKNA